MLDSTVWMITLTPARHAASTLTCRCRGGSDVTADRSSTITLPCVNYSPAGNRLTCASVSILYANVDSWGNSEKHCKRAISSWGFTSTNTVQSNDITRYMMNYIKIWTLVITALDAPSSFGSNIMLFTSIKVNIEMLWSSQKRFSKW